MNALKLMKLTALVALTTLSASAFAQGGGAGRPEGKPGRRMGQNRPGRNPGDRVSDRLMREAGQRIERAQRQLRQALPIYDGHRVNAIELSQIAQWEIRIGLAWDRMKEQGGPMGNKPGKSGEKEGRRGPNHSDEQVRKSNQNIVQAGKLLEDALALLKRAQADYGGHRKNAIEATERAIQQLKEALQSVGN
jgi:hypothetical protein